MLTLAGLGFLGFGIEPTAAAEWGYDLNKALPDVTSGIWWTGDVPRTGDRAVVLGVTLVGESLNDLADPRLRSARAEDDRRPMTVASSRRSSRRAGLDARAVE